MKTKHIILIYITLLFFGLNTYATEKSDEMILKQLSLYEGQNHTNQLKTANALMDLFYEMGLTDEQIKFDRSYSDSTITRELYYWSSEYFYDISDFKNALVWGLKALPLCNGSEIEADCLSLISLSYFRLSKFHKAAEYAKECYKLDEKSGDPDIMSSSLNTIAGIYLGANLPQEGEKYIIQALDLASKADNPARMSVILGMASEIFHALGKNKEALEYIEKACKIESDLQREGKLMVRLTQKASILIGLNKWEEAEKTLLEAIPYLKKSPNQQSYGIACNKMGMALLGQGRNDEAISYFKDGAYIFSTNGDIRNEMHSRKGLYESYWSNCQDSAKIELEKFNDLKDSLYNNATSESMAHYSSEFESTWLRLENQKQRKITEITLIISIIFVILLAINWCIHKRRSSIKEEALKSIINQLKEEKSDKEQYHHLDNAKQIFLRHIVSSIMKNISDKEYSVETLASDMCLTSGHLNRKIKSITGLTSQQYILRVRMEYAKHLLVHSPEITISQIAYNCGFEDAASFSRAFKRTYDRTPSQVRQEGGE